MPVHEIFNFSITLGTAVILFLVMQYLGHAVVRYLNRKVLHLTQPGSPLNKSASSPMLGSVADSDRHY